MIRLLVPALLTTTLLCAVFLVQAVPFTAFTQADARRASVESLKQLRTQGVWLHNVRLLEISHEGPRVCLTWEHRYRSRNRIADRQILTTCT